MNFDNTNIDETRIHYNPDHGIIFNFMYYSAIFTTVFTIVFFSPNSLAIMLYKIFARIYHFKGLKIKYYNIFLGLAIFFSLMFICIIFY